MFNNRSNFTHTKLIVVKKVNFKCLMGRDIINKLLKNETNQIRNKLYSYKNSLIRYYITKVKPVSNPKNTNVTVITNNQLNENKQDLQKNEANSNESEIKDNTSTISNIGSLAYSDDSELTENNNSIEQSEYETKIHSIDKWITEVTNEDIKQLKQLIKREKHQN